ncbi:MAG: 4Fe-4S dicluster domain-containing protein [Oscillospiraceae bacterium]|nr:4Fe-4S dicluster domain-containing protein [Oscillospiraceae bacterium]
MKVGCTGCRYCMPCPKGVDIPGIFAAWNRSATDGYLSAFTGYFMCTALRKDATGASNCVGCGKCEQHCPQGIRIREELKTCRRKFEGPVYKIGHKLVTTFVKY